MKETIVNVLSRADHGLLLDEANVALAEVAAAVLRTGMKGKVIVEITIAKTKGNNTGLEVMTNLKESRPVPARSADLYFADDDGFLSKRDPRQPDLPGTSNIEKIRS